jgi:hypothetical protein
MRGIVLLLPLLGVGCEGGEDCTTEGEFRCDGDVLQECVDGSFEDNEDCADDGMMCHAEMGHCMTPTE